jgi:hypothetical protein
MKAQRKTASFVLRFTQDLWQDAHGEPFVQWRGQVQRVQDGAELHFCDVADALSFIQTSLLTLTKHCLTKADPTQQTKALQESQKFCGQFTQTSPLLDTDQTPPQLMTSTPHKPINGIPAWPLSPSATSTQPEITTTPADETPSAPYFAAMQAQIESLTAKIRVLEQALANQNTPQQKTDYAVVA